jgi:hypothetical protein
MKEVKGVKEVKKSAWLGGSQAHIKTRPYDFFMSPTETVCSSGEA